jgi:CheY-like chemotaxis protein
MDGFETTRAIRKREKADHRDAIPVIALTANVQASDLQACREAGMNEHLSKPIRMEALRKILATYLRPR